MIAVMILGFSAAGIAMLLTASMQQNYLSEKYMLASNLAQDLMDASRGQGAAARRREEIHRMAEANRAFVHYRW